MSELGTIPSVKYLSAIEADNAGQSADILIYSKIGGLIKKYAETNSLRHDAFWNAEPDSFEEVGKARQLAFEYWLDTAEQAINSGPHNRDLWAERTTQASAELFGLPDKKITLELITHQQEEFKNLIGNELVDQTALKLILGIYNLVQPGQTEKAEDDHFQIERDQQVAVELIRDVINDRYSEVLDLPERLAKNILTPNFILRGLKKAVIALHPDANKRQPEKADLDKKLSLVKFDADDLVVVFEKAIKALARLDDPSWRKWKVTRKKGTSVEVAGQDEQFKIPLKKSAINTTQVDNLLGHEIFTHGLRAKNAKQSEDPRLLKGYPGYLDGEEGLAIIVGAAASGTTNSVIYDRYIDIALATGVVGDAQMKRSEVKKLMEARKTVRTQASGKKADTDKISHQSSVYVDRIFRGSPADDVGTKQAVYTADIYYYDGFRKVSSLIARAKEDGKSPDEIFDYLMQGKFDPNNKLHLERISKLGKPL
jgi:hypothetical protein